MGRASRRRGSRQPGEVCGFREPGKSPGLLARSTGTNQAFWFSRDFLFLRGPTSIARFVNVCKRCEKCLPGSVSPKLLGKLLVLQKQPAGGARLPGSDNTLQGRTAVRELFGLKRPPHRPGINSGVCTPHLERTRRPPHKPDINIACSSETWVDVSPVPQNRNELSILTTDPGQMQTQAGYCVCAPHRALMSWMVYTHRVVIDDISWAP